MIQVGIVQFLSSLLVPMFNDEATAVYKKVAEKLYENFVVNTSVAAIQQEKSKYFTRFGKPWFYRRVTEVICERKLN